MGNDLSSGLLSPGDPDPVVVVGDGERSPFLIVCDHAGRATPQSLRRLGLPDAAFETHIAWDIGVLTLGEQLGRLLGARVIAQTYSRLVVDCNRPPGHPQSIPEVSDGVAIPGNRRPWSRRHRGAPGGDPPALSCGHRRRDGSAGEHGPPEPARLPAQLHAHARRRRASMGHRRPASGRIAGQPGRCWRFWARSPVWSSATTNPMQWATTTTPRRFTHSLADETPWK